MDYRGHWWERLALNYDAHLKNPEKVFPCLVSKFATMKNHLPGRFVVNGKFLILKQFKVFLFNLLDCSPLIKNLVDLYCIFFLCFYISVVLFSFTFSYFERLVA